MRHDGTATNPSPRHLRPRHIFAGTNDSGSANAFVLISRLVARFSNVVACSSAFMYVASCAFTSSEHDFFVEVSPVNLIAIPDVVTAPVYVLQPPLPETFPSAPIVSVGCDPSSAPFG